MNQKIPFHDLSARIASATGISEESAELFVKNFFDLISEALTAGENVRIKEIGSFTVIDVDGERTVEFVPDKEITDVINAPFAMFEAVTLNDDLSDDMLLEVDREQQSEETKETAQPEETTVTEETTVVAETTPSPEETAPEAPEGESETAEETATPAEEEATTLVEEIVEDKPVEASYTLNIPVNPQPAETPQTPVEDTHIEETPVEETPAAETQIEETKIEETVVPAENAVEEKTEEIIAESKPAPPPAVEEPVEHRASNFGTPQVLTPPDIKPLHKPEPAPVPEPPKAPKVTTAPQPKPVKEFVDDTEEYVSTPAPANGNGNGNFWTGFIVGIIVGLALGACGVYLAIDHLFPTMHQSSVFNSEEESTDDLLEIFATENQNAQPAPETETAPAAESAAPVAETATPAPAETAAPEATPAPAKATAAVVTDTIRRGYLITNMAKKHYGSKDFWVYIYEENKAKIRNPNNMQPGEVLVIPAAEKYGIDASNQESLRKARAKAAQILR